MLLSESLSLWISYGTITFYMGLFSNRGCFSLTLSFPYLPTPYAFNNILARAHTHPYFTWLYLFSCITFGTIFSSISLRRGQSDTLNILETSGREHSPLNSPLDTPAVTVYCNCSESQWTLTWPADWCQYNFCYYTEHGGVLLNTTVLTQSSDVPVSLLRVDVDIKFPPLVSLFPLSKAPHSNVLRTLPTLCHGTSVCYFWVLLQTRPNAFP